MKYGIDVSEHQGKIDFAKVKASKKVDFVILREGYGKQTIDLKFNENVKGFKNVNIPVIGVYHFSYALDVDMAKREAISCISNLERAGLGKDTIVFYDFEYDSVRYAEKAGKKITNKDINNFTEAFCNEVAKLGYKAGVYFNQDYYKNKYDKKVLEKYICWLADYEGAPNYPCQIQQTSSTGKVDGINGDVDMNTWFKEDTVETPKEEIKMEVDLNKVADDVIAGKYGNGEERVKKLTSAGYSYKEVQDIVNKKVASKPASTPQPAKTGYAQSFDKSLAGTYVVTANSVNFRRVAGVVSNKDIIRALPNGTNVQCYGYYSTVNNIKWLYVDVNGTVGFICSSYIKRK